MHILDASLKIINSKTLATFPRAQWVKRTDIYGNISVMQGMPTILSPIMSEWLILYEEINASENIFSCLSKKQH